MKLNFGITGSTESWKNLIKFFPNIRFHAFKGDITNKIRLTNWIKKNNFEAIIHLAAIVPIKTVNQIKKKPNVNFMGTKYLVDGLLILMLNGFFCINFTCL